MTEKQCTNLHRIWVDQVNRCAQVPNRKDKNQTVVDSKQCEGKFSVYFIYKAKDKEDECFKPSFFERAKAVTKKTGGALGNVLDVGPRAFCQAKKGWHWDKHADTCKKDPPPAPTTSTSTSSPTVETGGGKPKAPDGSSWSEFCSKLNRNAVGQGCSQSCNNGKERNPSDLYYGYDKCTKNPQTGGGGNNNGGNTPTTSTVKTSCAYINQTFNTRYGCVKQQTITVYEGHPETITYCQSPISQKVYTGWYRKSVSYGNPAVGSVYTASDGCDW